MKRSSVLFKDVAILESKSGRDYLGCELTHDEIEEYLNDFRAVDPINFKKASCNQRKRDGHSFHVTIVSPAEYDSLSVTLRKRIRDLRRRNVQLDLVGIGQVGDEQNKSYFVVVNSATLDEIRSIIGLPSRDYHVTLGFYIKDVHGVRKDESTIIT